MLKKAYVEFVAVAKGQAFNTKNSGKGGLLPVVMMVDEGYPALGLHVHACEHYLNNLGDIFLKGRHIGFFCNMLH